MPTTLAPRQPRTAVQIGLVATADVSCHGCRTPAQHEAVMAHFRRHPSAWWTTNPFAASNPTKMYRCTFHLSYYDPQGRMCQISVSPRGKITDFFVLPAHDVMIKAAAETVARYGMFRG